ncbi:hypothetical protein BH10PLA2_BH10PLA2_10740 [soil metagenome]
MALIWSSFRKKTKAHARSAKKNLVSSGFKPRMETLEDRLTPAGSVFQLHIAPPSGAPNFTFGGTDLLVAEPTVGTAQLIVTVDRTGDTTGPGSVTFTTADETAASGVNYTGATGSVNFLAGETSKTFTVDILHTQPLQDGSLSGPKVFGISLSNPSAGDSINQLALVSAVTIRDTNGTQNQRYVNDVFFELLNRPADPGALQFFGNQLVNGTSRTQVLLNIESATFNGHNEYLDNTVNKLYQAYLGRNADAGGLAAFSAQLAGGATVQLVQAEIMASDEYFQASGSTNVGFVSAAYRDILNRNPDAGGLTFYLGMLSTPSTGAQRQAVISNLLGQTEAIQDILQVYYANYLNRFSDPAGLAFFTLELQNNNSLTTIINQFLGNTPEYFNGC